MAPATGGGAVAGPVVGCEPVVGSGVVAAGGVVDPAAVGVAWSGDEERGDDVFGADPIAEMITTRIPTATVQNHHFLKIRPEKVIAVVA